MLEKHEAKSPVVQIGREGKTMLYRNEHQYQLKRLNTKRPETKMLQSTCECYKCVSPKLRVRASCLRLRMNRCVF